MAWNERHGCEGPGVTGSAKHVGDPETVEEIKALAAGTRIVVTWAGGNGPHEGSVVHDPHFGISYISDRSPDNPTPLLSWPETQQRPLNRVTIAETKEGRDG